MYWFVGVGYCYSLSCMSSMRLKKNLLSWLRKTSLIEDDDMSKSITSKKLNGLNYLVWVHAVKVFLCGKKKLKYLTNNLLM